MSVRVYVPVTLRGLRDVARGSGIGPAPFVAHAVTEQVRLELADLGEEDQEYAASSAAAQSSVHLLADGEIDTPPRRVVLAVDVPAVSRAGQPDEDLDPTVVEVDEVVPFHRIAAVLADTEEAEQAVADARAALREGAADADEVLERCQDHDLGWWATQEIGDLLDSVDLR